jgi:hypothetical protein
MMGSRGYKGAAECDAFCPWCRRNMRWKPGRLRKIKRGYWKRTRRNARLAAWRDAKDCQTETVPKFDIVPVLF